jgi:16S rRNA (uracil1498-N3)-methyltransferase
MAAPRIHCPQALAEGLVLDLPAGAARHVQVLRMQPGHELTLFDGLSGQYVATITRMQRQQVQVQIGSHQAIEREATAAIHLAVGMPANERMDWLVEKATELGVASITPLLTERTVIRLKDERALKKREHWQSIAVASCEQCGRNRVPTIHPVQTLATWLREGLPAWPDTPRWILSFAGQILPAQTLHQGGVVLSGPEGGLSTGEEALAIAAGFQAWRLGERVLRAETAALAALTMATYTGGYLP